MSLPPTPPLPPENPAVPPAPQPYQSATPTYGAPQGGGYAPGGPDKTNVLAIVSLVSAFVVSLVAVITGHMALGQIKRTGENGRGLAIAGLVLGYLGIVGGILAILFFVVTAIAGVSLFAVAASNYDPDDYTSTSEPFATSEPGVASSNLTFEDGASLTASDLAQFSDPFLGDSAWTVKSPDDKAGNWSYTDPSGFCSVTFHQGGIEAGVVVPGDDRASTDAMLAVVLGSTSTELKTYFSDDTFTAGYFGDGSVADTRMISSTKDDGSGTLFAGRAFSGIPAGLYVIVDCAAGGDTEAVYNEVKTAAAIVVD